jgi:hypothetical protein
VTARKTRRRQKKTELPEALVESRKAPTDTDPVQRIVSFVLTQTLADVTPEFFQAVVTAALESLPAVLAKKSRVAARRIKSVSPVIPNPYSIEDTGNALSKWYLDPKYRLNGQLRALRLRGPAPSIESLMQDVNPAFDLKGAVKHLLEVGCIRKSGGWYVARSQIQSTRGSAEHARHRLRTQSFLLANQDHNSAPRERWPSWYDFAAEYPEFPDSQLPALRKFLWKQADEFLVMFDSFFHRTARRCKPGELTRRVVIGIYEARQPNAEQSDELTALLRLVRREMKLESRRGIMKAANGVTRLGKSNVGGSSGGKL